MDIVQGRGAGTQVFRGFNIAPELEIKMRPKHRQTEGISCQEEQNRRCHSPSFILERKHLSGNHGAGWDGGSNSGGQN